MTSLNKNADAGAATPNAGNDNTPSHKKESVMDSVSPEVNPVPEWAEQIEDWGPLSVSPRSKKLTGESARFILGKFTTFERRSHEPGTGVVDDLANLQMDQTRDDSTGEITHGQTFVAVGDHITLDAEQAKDLACTIWQLARAAEETNR